MKWKETLTAAALLGAMLVGMGQMRRVIRGSSWFEQNVSVCASAADVLNVLGAQTGSANLTNVSNGGGNAANWVAAGATNQTSSGVASMYGGVVTNSLGIGTSTPQTPLSIQTSGDTIGISVGDAGNSSGKRLTMSYLRDTDVALIRSEQNGTSLKGLTVDTSGTTLDASGINVSGGGLATGPPSGGSAATWKVGQLVTGASVALVTTNYIQLDIGGTLYKVAIVK